MSRYLAAVLIGIVEGLTEFLPVSSTAHIRIVQQWLGIASEDEYWKMFAVVIQLGAILAVIVYFRARLWTLLQDFLTRVPWGQPAEATSQDKLERRPAWWQHPLMLVLLAFVVTAVPCYLIDKKIGENLESFTIMGWALILGGIAMWGIDMFFHTHTPTTRLEDVRWWQAMVIGLSQIFAAAFPGTSRSMSTIAGGQIVGLSRATALEFSFFLSIPVMVAATLFKLLQFVVDQPSLTLDDGLVLAIGFAVSFFVAWGVIAWFMEWVRSHGFIPFAIYRIVAGGLVLWFMAK